MEDIYILMYGEKLVKTPNPNCSKYGLRLSRNFHKFAHRGGVRLH